MVRGAKRLTLEHFAMGLSFVLALWIAIGIRRSRAPKPWSELAQTMHAVFFAEKKPASDCPIPLHSWADLLSWPESLQKLLKRTSQHLHVIGIDTVTMQSVSQHLGIPYHNIQCDAEALANSVNDPAARLIMVAETSQAMPLLKLLHQYAGVRDYLAAVVVIDPVWDEEWIATHFTHEQMDAEASRQIIYICLNRGELSSGYHLTAPEIPPTGWNSISVITLDGFSDASPTFDKWTRLLAILFNRMGL